MKDFGAKFRLIFIPFLLIAILTISSYTLVHWLLCIQTTLIKLNTEITNFFVPLALPWLPILIWVMPRLKLLNLKNKSGKGDPLSGYLFVAWIIIAIPMVIAQEFLITATGKLTKVDHITQIKNTPPTKYYAVNHYYLDTSQVKIKSSFDVSGRHSENFNMHLYTPFPIFDKQIDGYGSNPLAGDSALFNKIVPNGQALIVVDGVPFTRAQFKEIKPDRILQMFVFKPTAAMKLYGKAAINGAVAVSLKKRGGNIDETTKPAAWLAISYRKTISNSLSASEKEAEYDQFVRESQVDFANKRFDTFVYLDKLGPSEDLNNFITAIEGENEAGISPVVLLPVDEPYEARNGNKLIWMITSFAIGTVVFLIALLFKPLKSKRTLPKNKSYATLLKDVKELCWPREGYCITPIIININVLLFLLMALCGLGFISFNASDLLKWGGNYRAYVINGQYWRLITSMFLHGGLMHLFFNMYGLIFVGIFLEPILGWRKYLLYYIVTGILASLVSIWWHANSVGVGASGAIFGMYGIFLALLSVNFFPKEFKNTFLISTSIFIGYNLIIGLAGNTDNAAHIGGLISGLILGYISYPILKKRALPMLSDNE